MKHNVIIAKRGRDKYLNPCLAALNEAAKNHDVHVYIVHDDPVTSTDDSLNLAMTDIYVSGGDKFNKSLLLNIGLKGMRQDFDHVSILDIDMIVSPRFFDCISVHSDAYYISGGYKLTEAGTKDIIENKLSFREVPKDYIDPKLVHENDNTKVYPSQISLGKPLYNKLLDILGTDNLYHGGFIGWGGEDSYLSLFSSYCHSKGIFIKYYNKHQWYHLYHPDARSTNEFCEEQHKKNIELLHRLNKANQKRVEIYLKLSKVYPDVQ